MVIAWSLNIYKRSMDLHYLLTSVAIHILAGAKLKCRIRHNWKEVDVI